MSAPLAEKIRIICATRDSQDDFIASKPLGQTLALRGYAKLEVRLFPQNKLGLSKVYNIALREAAKDPAILVFAHDDIFLCDCFWTETILSALERFDVLGVAGNKRRVQNQAGWAHLNSQFAWDDFANLSGAIGHGMKFPPEKLIVFGPSNQEVKLLDGVFIAARSELLLANNLYFDEQFEFDFYDMDFCRQAEALGLRMGTCPISLVHQSGGSFDSPRWLSGYENYLKKWRS